MIKIDQLLRLLLVVTSIQCMFVSCKKPKDPEKMEQVGDETPEDIMEAFDKFEVIDLNEDDIIGINGLTKSEFDAYLTEKYGAGAKGNLRYKTKGLSSINMSPNDQLVKLTNNLPASQTKYADRRLYSALYKTQPNGLAYVLGGTSDEVSDLDCNLAGFDCSGLLYRGALNTGIKIKRTTAAQQANLEQWKAWLKETDFTHIVPKITNLRTWNDGDWKTGDVIIFNGGKHIGTITKVNEGGIMKTAIIHSQGKPSLTCLQKKGASKGPKVMTDSEPGNWAYFISQKLSRLRFELKDSYNLKMRCIGREGYLYFMNLSIDTANDNSSEDEVTFKDYDGEYLKLKIIYHYDKKKEEIDFLSEITNSAMPGVTRTDVFTIPLSSVGEMIPSVSAFNNGNVTGCDAEYVLSSGFHDEAEDKLRLSNKRAGKINDFLYRISK